MRITIDEVQSRVASIVDQDEDTNNITSTDYSLRLKYINRSLNEWAGLSDWQVLFKEYNMVVSTSTGNASIVLPTNFRKLAGYPKITYDGTTTEEFPEVLPQEDGQYASSEKRLWLLGNNQDGYILRVFGVTLSSGASVNVPYFASPQSLCSPANISEIPNPEYLVQRTIAHIWEARGDEKFPLAKAEAEKILANMLEYENIPSRASTWDRIKTVEETKYGFRVGRD